MPNPVTVSIEYLYHFRCYACSGWWSIADFKWPDKSQPERAVFCPNCGTKGDLPEKPLTGDDFSPDDERQSS